MEEFQDSLAGILEQVAPVGKVAGDVIGRAVSLYQGDLLEGLYDDWILVERERLREKYLHALEYLIGAEKAAGHLQQALEHALQLVKADPYRESIHREVMRLYYALHRPEAALEQYSRCCAILEKELGLAPDDETKGLVLEIAHSSNHAALPYLPPVVRKAPVFESSGPASAALALVGRTGERSELLGYLESILDGNGGAVLLDGEAGVGKTRLVQEAARDMDWLGAQVLWGRTDPLAVAPPFSPLTNALGSGLSPLRGSQLAQVIEPIWIQALKPLIPELARQFPNLPAAPPLAPDQEPARLREAFVQFIHGWGQCCPLVLILEDLQWAGTTTLDLLPALMHRLAHVGVVILGTYRSEDVRQFPQLWERLQAIDRAGLRGRISLARLDEGATSELIRSCLGMGRSAPLFESRLYQETEGNPLFILETLRVLHEEGLLKQDESGMWNTPWDETTSDYAELPLPPGVESVIVRRLSRLDRPLRAVLNLAATLGSDFDFPLLAACSDQETPALLAALRELVKRQFLQETAESFHFSHEKIRQATYQTIEPNERVRLHRQAAAAFEKEHPDQANILAFHLSQGRVWDKAVGAYLAYGKMAAAQYLADAALDSLWKARQHLEEHCPFPQQRILELEFETWESSYPLLKLKGDFDACRQAVASMLELSQSIGMPDYSLKALLQQAAYLHEIASEDERAYETNQKAIDLAREYRLPRFEAQGWSNIGVIRKQQAQNQEAEIAALKALALYRELNGEERMVAEILLRLVFIYRDLGDVSKAQSLAEETLALTQAQDDKLNLAMAHNALAWVARARGEHEQEAQHCQTMYEQMHTIGYLYYEGVALNNLSLAHSAMTDYERGIEAGGKALQVFRRLDHKRGQTIVYLNLSSRYKETGRFEQAEESLENALILAKEMNFLDEEARMHLSYMELLTWGSNFTAAQEHLDRAAEISRQLNYPSLYANVAYRQGELCLARGDFLQAQKFFRQGKQYYQEAGWSDFYHLMESFDAICCLKTGNLDEAVQLSRQAVDGIEGSEMIVSFHHFQIMNAVGQNQSARIALAQAVNQAEKRVRAAPDETCRHNLLEEVPLHKEIMAARAAYGSQKVTVRLPRLGAPTGRPLRDNEWADVTWTVSCLEDEALPNKAERRQRQILRLLEEARAQQAAPTVSDLADALGVSRATIKRDLAALRGSGQEVKTRGG